MSSAPSVSVVIPAFNAADFIGAAISGALNQSHPRVSVVVVDDGSSDETAAIAEAYGDRVHVVRQVNSGPSSARNAGIAATRSDYVAFCDADDVLMPRHVEFAVRAMATTGRRTWAASASWNLVDDGIRPRSNLGFYYGTPCAEDQVSAILAANFVPILCTVPRQMLDEIGGFDEDLVWCEDWDLWLRAILHGWRTAYVRERTALYRVTAGSLSAQKPKMVEGHKAVLRKTLATESARLTPEQLALVEARLAAPSYIELKLSASDALDVGDLRRAKSLFRQIAQVNPLDRAAVRRAALLRFYPASQGPVSRKVSSFIDVVAARTKRVNSTPSQEVGDT